MHSRWMLSALTLGAVWAGCGDDREASSVGSDPAAVSKAFIRAVSTGDSRACGLLTANGAEFVEQASGASSCEEGIEARNLYVKRTFYGTSPDDLADRLETGHVQLKNGAANFRFCTPTKVQVNLGLVEAAEGWQINTVVASKKETVIEGELQELPPCRKGQ
jgi:hypothetical protein